MHWLFPEFAAEEAPVAALASELNLHPVATEILWRRGYRSSDRARAFLEGGLASLPDPSSLLGIERAVDRLVLAIERREKVVAYGDYDVDGVTSTTLLLDFLHRVGAQVDYYIPHRLIEGYGLNPQAVRRLAAEGAQLIVTLDCGVTSVAEVDQAVALGVDVIVVDHHRVSPELPRATAIVNPQQPECTFPSKQLCAAGVTFFLLAALRRRLRERGHFASRVEPNLKSYLDLVALATVADVVPLTEVNRLLVQEGLRQMGETRRPGLLALLEVAGLPTGKSPEASDLAFRLAPRLNAAGRLDDAGRAVRLLSCATLEQARPLATALDVENQNRRRLEAQVFEEAWAMAQPSLGGQALVLSSERWHPGVVGIVASKIAERAGRPALLLCIEGDIAKGSGRSVPGFDLFEALSDCRSHLERFGGHAAAAGLALRAERLPDFREAFQARAAQQLSAEARGPRCRIDVRVDPGHLDERLASDLGRLGPFGAGNPTPVLAAFGLRAQARTLEPRAVGAEPHLKLRVAAPGGALDAIGFGLGGEAALCAEPIDAAFHLEMDEWRGSRRLQLRLKAIRASSGLATPAANL